MNFFEQTHNHFDYDIFFKNSIESIKNEGRYRIFADLERIVGQAPYALWHRVGHDPKKVIIWCSNDYLGMAQHPDVIKAMLDGVEKYGCGSGGTRNIGGTSIEHVELEKIIAIIHGKEKGLIFSSGYTANEGALSALGNGLKNCIFFSDAKNHASIIKGIKNSGAEKIIFSHNDVNDLRKKLASVPINYPKIIVFTSVYSMDGDFAPIAEIVNLSKEFNALTYLDEVHAVGLYGDNGAGMANHVGLAKEIDIIQGNFAKGYGVVGGYVTGKKNLIDFIRSQASGFIFTTSLPPAIAMAAIKSVEILAIDSDNLRQKLFTNVKLLKSLLSKNNIDFVVNNSHIVPILIGCPILCKKICDIMMENYGIYVQPINYPTVPKGQERIRVTVTSLHTFEMIKHFVDSLQSIFHELRIFNAA